MKWVYFSLVCVMLLFAIRRGGAPERAVLAILAVSDAVDLVYHGIAGPSNFSRVDYVHLVIDTVTLSGLLWVALGANRFWPLPVCSLQLIGVTSHIAILLGAPGIRGMYWAMITVPHYLQLLVALAGFVAHVRRTEKFGRYRDWRHQWPRPGLLAPKGSGS